MTHSNAQVGRSMAKGAAWMILLRLSIRGLGLVSTVILARLLLPADFGLVALATMIIAATEILSEFSFDVALIQNQHAQRSHYDTVWTMTVLRGGLTAALVLLFAAPAAHFFAEPRLTGVMHVLVGLVLLDAVQNVGIIDFRKNLDFRRDFFFTVWPRLFAFFVTIVLAYYWRSYWALVAGIVTGRASLVAASYVFHPYRPRPDLREWRGILGFSGWMLFSNIVNFLYVRVDTFIIARMAGSSALGIYSVAFEIANMATTELVAPIRRAILPGYAKIAHDPALLRYGFLEVWALTLALALPIAAGIGLVADPLVKIALGSKWLEAIPVMQMLSVYGLASISMANIAPLFQAMGKPRVPAVTATLCLIAAVPLLVLGTWWNGIVGAAAAISLSNVLFLVMLLAITLRSVGLGGADLLRTIWRSLLSCGAMALVVVAIHLRWVGTEAMHEQVAKLACSVIAGAATYIGLHLALWRLCGFPRGTESRLIEMARAAIRRLNVRGT